MMTVDEIIKALEEAKASVIVTGDSFVEVDGNLGPVSEVIAERDHGNRPAIVVIY